MSNLAQDVIADFVTVLTLAQGHIDISKKLHSSLVE